MIKTKDYSLKSNETVKICPLSDMHIGSTEFDEEFFDYAIKTIKKIKSNARIYVLGDILESANKTVGNASFRTNMTLEDQKALALDYLEPISKNIVCIVKGNHEARLEKDYDFNIIKDMARELGVPSCNQFMDTITINDKPFSIYGKHGVGSSKWSWTAKSKIIRESMMINADLFMEGHNHRLDFFNEPIMSNEGLRRRYYLFSGAFLDYNGYAEAMTKPVLPCAFQICSLNQERRITSTPYYIDERCPELEFY